MIWKIYVRQGHWECQCSYFFQSTSQIDVIDDGKGLEKQEIFDNSDCFICLKNTDDKLAEYLNKTVPKNVFLDKSYKEFRKRC